MDIGVVHTMEPTAANVADIAITNELIHGNEDEVYRDRGYTGAEKRLEAKKRNKQGEKIKYKVMRRPSSLKKLSKGVQRKVRKAEHQKSSIRCKIEYVFGVVKNLFKCRKIRYRGIKKVSAQLHMVFALANLFIVVSGLRLD